MGAETEQELPDWKTEGEALASPFLSVLIVACDLFPKQGASSSRG
jgi:hypothetical protein